MGGFGSGRRDGKPLVESSLVIDLNWIIRNGRAKHGARIQGELFWTRRGLSLGAIEYHAIMDQLGQERLELSYMRGDRGDQECVQQVVHLCFSVHHFGGKRWWMSCPTRGHHVDKLYLPPGGDLFASRQAWRLGYHSGRVTQQVRALDRVFALQRKLNSAEGLGLLPRRPRGMWARTYERHLRRYWELEHAAHSELVPLIWYVA